MVFSAVRPCSSYIGDVSRRRPYMVASAMYVPLTRTKKLAHTQAFACRDNVSERVVAVRPSTQTNYTKRYHLCHYTHFVQGTFSFFSGQQCRLQACAKNNIEKGRGGLTIYGQRHVYVPDIDIAAGTVYMADYHAMRVPRKRAFSTSFSETKYPVLLI